MLFYFDCNKLYSKVSLMNVINIDIDQYGKKILLN